LRNWSNGNAMASLQKRIEAVEKACSAWHHAARDAREELSFRALRRLSDEQLALLRVLARQNRDAATDDERAAQAACRAALEMECQQAGFSGWAAFTRWYDRRKSRQPARSRRTVIRLPPGRKPFTAGRASTGNTLETAAMP